MKRITAWILTIIMVIEMLPVQVFAQEAETIIDQITEQTETVEELRLQITEPAAEPTAEPTTEPAVEPTTEPAVLPSAEPVAEPTAEPTVEPTALPTAIPTAEPTITPTVEPTAVPTVAPTAQPTVEPTAVPTARPTVVPTAEPITEPTPQPEATLHPAETHAPEPTQPPEEAENMYGTAEDGSVTWSITDGVLTISGSGEMPDTLTANDVPWRNSYYIVDTVIVEEGITSICHYAFKGFTKLKNVSLPSTLTEIRTSAFENCTSLETIDIPDSVTTLGSFAFAGCTALSALKLPASLTTIGYHLLKNNTLIKEIFIPKSVTAVYYHSGSGYAPFQTSAVEKIEFESGITIIPEKICGYAASLKEVIIPDTVTEIGAYAFTGCSALAEITLPQNLIKIDNYAFYGCSAFTEIAIPENVTFIGEGAFNSCTNLKKVHVRSLDHWFDITIEGDTPSNSLWGDSYVGTPFANGADMYINGQQITEIVIPDGTTEIKNYIFRGIKSIKKITIPDTVTTIGREVFRGCGIEEITIPEGITRISEYMFAGCTSLTNVNLPDTITSIGHHAFDGCSSLAEFTVPDKVTDIGWYAFQYCTALANLKLSSSLRTLGTCVISGCTSLKNLVIPKSVISMLHDQTTGIWGPVEMLHWCLENNSLEKIEFSEGITKIPDYALYNCTNINEIIVPHTVTTVGKDAFYGFEASGECGDDMEWEIDFNERTLYIRGSGEMEFEGDAPWSKYKGIIGKIRIGNGLSTPKEPVEPEDDRITSIRPNAFRNLSSVVKIEIPDSVEEIGERAFFNCSNLKKIFLGEKVNSLGQYVMGRCPKLETVLFRGKVPYIDNNALATSAPVVYKIPESSKALWKTALETYADAAAVKIWDDTMPERDIVIIVDTTEAKMDAKEPERNKAIVRSFIEALDGYSTNTRIALIEIHDGSVYEEHNGFVHHHFSADTEELAETAENLTWHWDTYSEVSYWPNGEYAFNKAYEMMQYSTAEEKILLIMPLVGWRQYAVDKEIVNGYAEKINEIGSIYGLEFRKNNGWASGYHYSLEQWIGQISESSDHYFKDTEIDKLISVFKGGDSSAESGADYNGRTRQVTMRIYPMEDKPNTSARFKVTVGDKEYVSDGRLRANKYYLIQAEIPGDYTGETITISGDGYYSYDMPMKYVMSSNSVAMFPVPEKAEDRVPFTQALYFIEPKTNRLVVKNALIDKVVISEDVESQIYTDVNWNGFEPDYVVLQEDDFRCYLADKSTVIENLMKIFVSGAGCENIKVNTVYRLDNERSSQSSTDTNISVRKLKIDIDLDFLGDGKFFLPGGSFGALTLFDDGGWGFDFGSLFSSGLVMEFASNADGTIEGVIGYEVDVYETGDKNTKAYKEKLDKTIKDLKEDLLNWGRGKQSFKEWRKSFEKGRDKLAGAQGKKGKFAMVDIDWFFKAFFKAGFIGDKYSTTECGFIVGLEGEKTWTKPFIVSGHPMYVDFGFGADGALVGALSYNPVTEELESNKDLELEAGGKIFGSLNYGVKKLASGGIKGTGELDINTYLPLRMIGTRMYVSGNIAFVGTFMGLQGSVTLYKSPKFMFFKDGEFMFVTEDTQELEMVPYPYVPKDSTFYTMTEATSIDNFTLLKADTGYFTDPQLQVYEDGTMLLVWVDDIPGRAAVDRGGLLYSIYDGTSWSEPAQINDDGTTDYAPEIVIIDGNTYITWANYTQTFGETYDSAAITERVDMSVAQFDTVTKTITSTHTFTNPGFDSAPQLYSTENGLTMAWTNGVTSETVYRSVLTDGIWSSPAQTNGAGYTGLTSEIPSDYTGTSLQAANDVQLVENQNSRGIVYMKYDESGAQNLYVIFNDGSGWGEDIQITKLEEPMYVDSFSAHLDDSQKLTIAANVRSDSDASGDSQLGYFTYYLANDISVDYADYERYTMTGEKEVTFYADVTNNSPHTVSNVKMRLMDENGTTLRSQTISRNIPSGATQRIYINYTLPRDFAAEKLTARVVMVDEEEINLNNNEYTFSVYHTDISVEEIVLDSTPEETSLLARIVNRGSTVIPQARITVHKDSTNGELLMEAVTDSLAPGDVYLLDATLDTVLTENTVIYVVADNLENENLYDNNRNDTTVTTSFKAESLELDDAYMNLEVEENAQLTATVTPAEFTNAYIGWSSSDNEVATVDRNGVVTAVGEGICTITAWAVSGVTAECTVVVGSGEQIYLDADTFEITKGQNVKITTEFKNFEAKPETLIWTAAPEGVVTLSNKTAGGVTVKGGSVTEETKVTITAETPDGESTNTIVLILKPQVTKVNIYALADFEKENLLNGQTIPVDISDSSQIKMSLYALAESEDAFQSVKWKSSSAVATVDENGRIRFNKPGNVTITATATDGSDIKAQVKFNVVFLDSVKTFTAKTDAAAIGLQPGQTAQMLIYGTDKDNAFDKEMFTYEVTAGGDYIAVDSRTGEISVLQSGGTGTVKATLTDDPLGRTATVKVKTIPLQTMEITATAEMLEGMESLAVGGMFIDNKKVQESDFVFGITTETKDLNGTETSPEIKWTSSNTKVASVADGVVTVKKGADGTAIITATVNDLQKAKAEFVVDVRNYTPRTENTTVTMNTATTVAGEVQLLQAYDAEILSAAVEGIENFTSVFDTETDTLKIFANDALKNGSYKLTVSGESTRGEWSLPVTVKVANKIPAVTVKQKSSLNLFYTDSTAEISATVKDTEITDIRLLETESYTGVFDGETLTINRTSVEENDVNAKISVYLENYRVPVIKTVKINAKSVKPTLIQSKTSTKLTVLNLKGAAMEITDKASGNALDWSEYTVSAAPASEGYITLATEGTSFVISPVLTDGKFKDGKASHAAKIEVKGENWSEPVTLTHNLTVNSTAPTLKAKSATLTLNRLFDGTAETELIPSLANCPVPARYIIAPQADNANTAKIKVSAEGWNLKAALKDAEDVPANGNYKYDVIAVLDTDGGELLLNKFTVTVKVVSAMPKVSLTKTSVTLNNRLEDSAAVELNIPQGYELADVKINRLSEDIVNTGKLNVQRNGSNIDCSMFDMSVAKGNYKYSIVPVVRLSGGTKTAEMKALTLTVKVISNTAAITASSKGTIDLVNRNVGITYTITGGKNVNYTADKVERVSLTGKDAEKFTVEILGTNTKGQLQVIVRAKDIEVFSAGTGYQYALGVKLAGINDAVSSQVYTVKPKQTALKLNISGDTTVYQSGSGGQIAIGVKTPAGAQIAVTENAVKGTTVPEGALNWTITTTDGISTLSYTVENSALLKPGANYKIALTVTPVGNAGNKTPQKLTVTIKVKR